MSLLDQKLILCEDMSVASTADTTNTIDFGGARDLSNNYKGAGYLNVVITTTVAGTGLTFKLKDSADNSTFADVGSTYTLTAATKGTVLVIKLPKTKRYVKGVFTADTGTAGKATVFIGQPEA